MVLPADCVACCYVRLSEKINKSKVSSSSSLSSATPASCNQIVASSKNQANWIEMMMDASEDEDDNAKVEVEEDDDDISRICTSLKDPLVYFQLPFLVRTCEL